MMAPSAFSAAALRAGSFPLAAAFSLLSAARAAAFSACSTLRVSATEAFSSASIWLISFFKFWSILAFASFSSFSILTLTAFSLASAVAFFFFSSTVKRLRSSFSTERELLSSVRSSFSRSFSDMVSFFLSCSIFKRPVSRWSSRCAKLTSSAIAGMDVARIAATPAAVAALCASLPGRTKPLERAATTAPAVQARPRAHAR